MRALLLCLAMVFGLSGCAVPTARLTADISDQAGPKPSTQDSEKAVLAHLFTTLKDPDSLKQFGIVSGPTYITWYRGLLNGGQHDAGWLVCFEYNAKNSYGGYVGLKREGVAIKNIDKARVVNNVNWAMATRSC